MQCIYKAAGVLIKNNKLLVAKSYDKDIFIAPGGKIEKSESAEQSLIRELYEEFTIRVSENNLEFFGSFEALAAGQQDCKVIMQVFKVLQWEGEMQVSSEIETLAWIRMQDVEHMHIGSIFAHDVMPQLFQLGLID